MERENLAPLSVPNEATSAALTTAVGVSLLNPPVSPQRVKKLQADTVAAATEWHKRHGQRLERIHGELVLEFAYDAVKTLAAHEMLKNRVFAALASIPDVEFDELDIDALVATSPVLTPWWSHYHDILYNLSLEKIVESVAADEVSYGGMSGSGDFESLFVVGTVKAALRLLEKEDIIVVDWEDVDPWVERDQILTIHFFSSRLQELASAV